ncbi:hypothetical protein [Tautonia plasticadhaerens]|uniref:Uncharacterized protein n=1 Tax=Tautonia plasticadhaerens TaxID=2527974 RepID=A0A518H9L5_9BACT|nr:hypothetical protein [Tautonia plasticadhaerens]QDV37426.1 hypothetical protein ElP_53650 [Tautonia plasticadhaerens]
MNASVLVRCLFQTAETIVIGTVQALILAELGMALLNLVRRAFAR